MHESVTGRISVIIIIIIIPADHRRHTARKLRENGVITWSAAVT